jgi:hypothetical protein
VTFYRTEYNDTEINISKISLMVGGNPQTQYSITDLANCESELSRENSTFVKVRGSKPLRPLNIVQHEHATMQATPNTITAIKLRDMR